jgi:prolyl-tRNA synthetase
MRCSALLLPTLKDNPAEAAIVSHRLMLRAGLIRQEAAGIYYWLPLGLKVLRNIENVIRREMEAAGAQEVLLPTIQPAELWHESGRYEAYGPEMLRMRDRHDREILFGPTNEEAMTDIFRREIKSYKQLPQLWYQIQWKFRDEIRPRFGVMRGREFLMKDAYSFDLDFDGAKRTYEAMFRAYLRTFRALGVTAIPMRADPGAIGGTLSHEFHIMADTGESGLFYDAVIEERDDLTVDELAGIYAATDELHQADTCPVPPERLRTRRGIEVGHIFYFGTKYSEAMGARVTALDGSLRLAEMGSYGIGVSRLVGAIIEASHDDRGIIWPLSIAPYRVGLINLRVSDSACVALCEQVYAALQAAGISVLYDDRDASGGAKQADMDLIGLPWQVIVGPRGAKDGGVEMKQRRGGETITCAASEVVGRAGDVTREE